MLRNPELNMYSQHQDYLGADYTVCRSYWGTNRIQEN